jgi:hypothetical protein
MLASGILHSAKQALAQISQGKNADFERCAGRGACRFGGIE